MVSAYDLCDTSRAMGVAKPIEGLIRADIAVSGVCSSFQ